ncbi:S-layer homology domain-containing protein [Sphaerothrix gracilis]|uniref:S-layer homology domain-containing protein n=1 Tax=Sphaerothrix gracilis TaxID=3151835 RepID=UPI0031FD2FD9
MKKLLVWPHTNFRALTGLAIGLTTILTTSATAQAETFSDIAPQYWAVDYISALADRGILSGYPDGTFRPEATVTRAEFAAILVQAFPTTEPLPEGSIGGFIDVPADYWGYGAIDTANAAGFLIGYPSNEFRPEQTLSRAQALVSLANGLDYSSDTFNSLSYYTDAAAIPDYARASIAAATQAEIVVNYPTLTRLQPNRGASRADVAAFVYQALVQEGQIQPLADPSYVVGVQADRWSTTPIATLPTRAQQLSVSRDGTRIATLSPSGDLIQIWQGPTGALITEIATDGTTRFEAIALSHDGTQVAAIAQTLPDKALTLQSRQVEAGQQLWQQPLGTAQGQFRDEAGFVGVPLVHVGFQPGDGQVLSQVSLGFGPADRPTNIQLQLHAASTGEAIQSLANPSGSEHGQFAFSPDGEWLAGMGFVRPDAGSEVGQVITVWSMDTGRVERTLALDSNFGFVDMVFTGPDILRSLSQNLYDLHLDTWNVRTGDRLERITELRGVDRQDRLGRLSPDGQYYFVRGDVAGTRLINIATTAATYFNLLVEQAQFDSTGNYLAIATQDDVQVFVRDLP